MSLSLLVALAANPAQAESEILFRANRPVLIFVDGRQAPLTSNLRMRAAGLEPGRHEVEVKGVFGKTLYEGELQLDDWTLAYAEWTDGELDIYRTEKLDKRRQRARQSPWSDEDEEVLDEEEVVEGEDVELEPTVPPAAPEGLEAEEPLAETTADEPAEEAALALPAEDLGGGVPIAPEPPEVVEPEVAVVSPGAILVDKTVVEPSAPQAVMIQAREGVRFELLHGDTVLSVTVRDGAFVVDFPVGDAE